MNSPRYADHPGRKDSVSIPIKPDLGVLGRRWALVILADVGFRGISRFSELRRSNTGITPRMLSKRLRDLEKDGMICRLERSSPKLVRWGLTEKGADALPTVMSLVAYGARWNTNYKFQGVMPKVLTGPSR